MSFIKKFIPKRIKQFLSLTLQFIHDFRMYYKHSSVFKMDTYGKIESEITLRYHSIEKGFLHNPIRPRFAKKRVEDLIALIKQVEIDKNFNRIQIQSALLNLCNYYEYHLKGNIDISDYFLRDDYDLFKRLLTFENKPIKYHSKDSFFKNNKSDFKNFSISRASVRSFTGEKTKIEIIKKVVDLANHAPSVCNRQSINVHLVENKLLIDKILEIQGGLKGYSDDLSQLIVVTSDRNYFYSVGERHQLYIDGGIYIMNFLYALHFYGVGACPAHWGMPYQADEKVLKLLNLKEGEQIISLVAIGVTTENFSTTLSLRKASDENLFIHS
ncbi:MAG: nitroreductase family protein [Tissierellia bacterium]|nr:nitroreductase family protein [Tissierellia bacterium]